MNTQQTHGFYSSKKEAKQLDLSRSLTAAPPPRDSDCKLIIDFLLLGLFFENVFESELESDDDDDDDSLDEESIKKSVFRTPPMKNK